MPQYVSETELRESRMGVDISKLLAGELVRWIEKASDAIEDEAHLSFAPQDGVVERLRGGGNEAIVSRDGDVYLYPKRSHPIREVKSITVGAPGEVPVSVPLADVDVVPDETGDGRYVQVFGDYRHLRGGRVNWTITYDGGYEAATPDDYPSWLRSCALEWTAGLLQRRGAQAIVLEGSGGIADTSNIGKHLETAKGYLDHKKRRF